MNMTSSSVLQTQMAERHQRLIDIAAQLKTELFGIDDVIDRVIDSLRAWYILPQCITRPVIVCLWGLTGTGKTQLTRSAQIRVCLQAQGDTLQTINFPAAWHDHNAAIVVPDTPNRALMAQSKAGEGNGLTDMVVFVLQDGTKKLAANIIMWGFVRGSALCAGLERMAG